MTQFWYPWFWYCTHYICVLHNYMYIILFIWIYKYAPFLTTETNIEFLVVSNNHPHLVLQLDQNLYEVASEYSNPHVFTQFFRRTNSLVVYNCGPATSILIIDIWRSSLDIMDDFKLISRTVFFRFGEINKSWFWVFS